MTRIQFQNECEIFFTEQLINRANVPTETFKEGLKNMEKIWLKKRKTLTHNTFNLISGQTVHLVHLQLLHNGRSIMAEGVFLDFEIKSRS